MGWFKKNEVPEELPNLAMDEANLNSQIDSVKVNNELQQVQAISQPQQIQRLPSQGSVSMKKSSSFSDEDDQGYFKDLIKSVTEDTDNLDKVDSWYKDRFLPGDMVFQMREYWEKQQPGLLLKNVSGELKNKLVEKTDRMHQLEKEWQEVYFQLLSKEEAIRKEEKELKESLSEFIQMVKNARKRNDDKKD